MIALQLSLALVVFFVAAFLLTNFLPIIKKNLLIPLTLVFILFFLLIGNGLDAPDIKDPHWINVVQQIEKALGFNIWQVIYWMILFLIWLLLAGVSALVFELFMRERADEITNAAADYLSLFGIRNILIIMCVLVPLMVLVSAYFKFMSSQLMFLSMLCFTSGQLEVLFSSAKKGTMKVGEKNLLFLVSISVVNVMVLFFSLVIILLKRIG